MDIAKRLEQEHSLTLTNAIIKYIGDDKKRFKVLMDLFFKAEPRVVQRAAWPMSYVAINNPKLIYPYLDKLIRKLNEPGNHPAIPRNIMRFFEEIEIPEKHEGPLVDVCFKLIVAAESPIAVKAFAITVATSICKKYPELKQELRLHLEHMQNYPMTAAIKVRIKRALKILNT
ncbi:MAG: hypothetical protein H0W73_18085 [Bacteroidetes bacterium]|nr:hypothetical protein [Bacteroidota bacterium]